jgi:hypothetical protein
MNNTLQINVNANKSGKMFISSIFWSFLMLSTCFHTGILLGLFFNPEDGGDMFL